MVTIEITTPWITEEQFEQTLVIENVKMVPSKYGSEPEVTLRLGLDTYRLSVFGKNKAYLVNTFGPDTDSWLGQKILITGEQVGKSLHRVIRTPK